MTDTDEPEERFIATGPIENQVPNGWYRLRVEWDPFDYDLTEIADERMTSGKPTAQPITGKGAGQVICLREDQVEWLHAALGRLIEHRRRLLGATSDPSSKNTSTPTCSNS